MRRSDARESNIWKSVAVHLTPTPPQSSPYQGEEEVIQKLKVLVEHTKLFEKMLMHPAKGESASGGKNFAIMKKHFKAYVNGWEGAKELRVKLMETENAKQVEKIVSDFLCKI